MSDISFERMYRMRAVDLRGLDEEDIQHHHVVHLKMQDEIALGNRIVAVRPTPYHGVELTFSDAKHGVRDVVQRRTPKQALTMIRNFLTSPKVVSRRAINTPWGWFDAMINQAYRECEVVQVNPARVRIEYEMPNSGMNGAWRKASQVGNHLYIQEY